MILESLCFEFLENITIPIKLACITTTATVTLVWVSRLLMMLGIIRPITVWLCIENVNDKQLQDLIEEADIDGDGKIGYKDFYETMKVGS